MIPAAEKKLCCTYCHRVIEICDSEFQDNVPSACTGGKVRKAYDRFEALPEADCKCGLKKIPAGADGIHWYWQLHSRTGCTLELPDSKCWCGLKRSEHINGHDRDAENARNEQVYSNSNPNDNRYSEPDPDYKRDAKRNGDFDRD